MRLLNTQELALVQAGVAAPTTPTPPPVTTPTLPPVSTPTGCDGGRDDHDDSRHEGGRHHGDRHDR